MSDSTLGLGASHADPYFWISDNSPHDPEMCIDGHECQQPACAETIRMREVEDCETSIVHPRGACNPSCVRGLRDDESCAVIIEEWPASQSGPREALTCDRECAPGLDVCQQHHDEYERELAEGR